MIETINKRIDLFISSIDGISKNSVQIILNKFSTSISEDLDKGHLTTNVCMIAASVLKLNPKELAKELKDNLDDLDIFKDVQIAGPGFVNITLHKKEFVSACNFIGLLTETKDEWDNFKKNKSILSDDYIENKIKERNQARDSKNYELADKIRNELLEKGVQIEDKDGKTSWKFK